MPYEIDVIADDQWWTSGILPAGTYYVDFFCNSLDLAGLIGAIGTCGDLRVDATPCPTGTGVTVALDGTEGIYWFLPGEPGPDDHGHAIILWRSGGCPTAGPTQTGSAAGGGSPESIQSGSSGPLLDGQAGGGGGPAAVLTPGGSVTDTGAAAGGGGPEAVQTGM